MGGQVRKGEQGLPVVQWKITKPSETGGTDGEDEAGGGKRGSFFVRYYNVFNLARVDGATLPADTAPELPECERIAHAEAFIAALPGLDRPMAAAWRSACPARTGCRCRLSRTSRIQRWKPETIPSVSNSAKNSRKQADKVETFGRCSLETI
jgi:hypothetical protein